MDFGPPLPPPPLPPPPPPPLSPQGYGNGGYYSQQQLPPPPPPQQPVQLPQYLADQVQRQQQPMQLPQYLYQESQQQPPPYQCPPPPQQQQQQQQQQQPYFYSDQYIPPPQQQQPPLQEQRYNYQQQPQPQPQPPLPPPPPHQLRYQNNYMQYPPQFPQQLQQQPYPQNEPLPPPPPPPPPQQHQQQHQQDQQPFFQRSPPQQPPAHLTIIKRGDRPIRGNGNTSFYSHGGNNGNNSSSSTNNNNNRNNDFRRGNMGGAHASGVRMANFTRSEYASCGTCNAISASFHGFHKYFGDKEFFRLMNTRRSNQRSTSTGSGSGGGNGGNGDNNATAAAGKERECGENDEEEDEDDEDDDEGGNKFDRIVRHMFGVVCEMLEFYYSDDSEHTFEHSRSTQERSAVHSLCDHFGMISKSSGFHPKRRVSAAKFAKDGEHLPEIRELTEGKIRGIARKALQNKKTISSSEKMDSAATSSSSRRGRKKAGTLLIKRPGAKATESNDKKEGEGGEEENGKEGSTSDSSSSSSSSSSDNETEKKLRRSNGSPLKKRPKIDLQTQTGLVEPLDLEELKQRLRVQIDQELHAVATGGELIEKLHNIEREVAENYSVPSFEDLRHGSFVAFLDANRDMLANISVGSARGAGEGAQDPLFSRIPAPEELAEYVAQYTAHHHDTKVVDKVVHSVMAQFDVPARCFKSVYAKVSAALETLSSSESQAATVATATTTTKHVNRQYLRAYIGDSTFSAWTPEKAVEFPLDSDVPPMVDALTWGRIAKRQNVASLDASGVLNESDFVFLDNGIAVKRTEGKGLCRAVAECDPWGAVSEIVSLVVSNDGRLPVELCSQQCASGFAAMKLSPFRFLLDFLKLLPPVFYETADGLIKSVVVDPFVGAFGRLETAFFALVADPGDRAYAKSALSLLGVDVTGFADKPSICTGAAAAAVAGIPSGVQLSNSVSSGGFDDEEDVTAVAVPVQNSRGAISVGVSASGNGVNSGATGFGAGTPEAVIDDIRRNEFGIGVETDERTQRTLKAQYEREARAIERLSSELYTQDAHFFLELLQNADDNKYPAEPGLCPTLELEFTPAALIVRNNEIGFSERDVRAICDIANSTKSSSKRAEAGQTGEKGIGFKAVFRVSDRPQIHSNGYHFEFDADSAPVKFIVPRWIGGGNSCSCGYALQDPGTTIVLPWRKDVAHKAGALFNRMASVNAESLLFLRRLAKIVVKNAASGEVRAISREVHPLPPPKCGSGCVTASVVRMRVGEGKEEKEEAVEGGSWLVVEKKLFPQVTRRGATVRQTALSLGFRLAKDQSALADEFCSVCALLPLCASRFRFIVQGDFVSSASREGLDEDVAWNQWLRSEVPDVFVHAVEAEFLTSPAATSENLRYTWYAFVPTPRDGTGLFASVPTEILRKLSAIECVLSEDGRNVLPKKALLVPDAVRSLFPQSAVDAVFGSSLRYCHPRVSASAPAVLQLLGAQTFGVSHLVALLSKLPALPVPKDDAWFRALFGFLCDYVEPVLLKDSASETAFYDGLRSAPFLPTESPSGELGDPSSVFVMKHNEDYLAADPDAEEEKAGESAAQDVDSRMVRFSVLRSLDPVLRSKALALLQRLGVRTYSEHEHVLRHVLPALPELDSEEAILAKTRIVYKHWKSCSICLSDNRSLSRKLHNGLPILLLPPSTSSSLSLPTKKFCFLKDACVHFRPRFRAGPASALWNVLSGAYPAQWREFFEFVGVRDSLCVLPEQNVLSLDGPSALWHGVALPPASSHSYSVEDFVCPEFSSLVSGIKALPQSDAHGAMEELAHLCEDDWLVLSKCLAATVRYCDPATGAELSQQVPSSFLATLRSTKWVLSGERAVTITTTASSGSSSSGSSSNEASRFRAPSTLFADNPECATFVGVIGPYPKVPLSESFAREIGVRFAVGPDDALGLLLRWAKAGETRQTREQMESVYKKAAESPSFKDAAAHHGRPLVFDPKGKRYVSPGQAFWDDPSERFVSLVDAGYAQDMKAVFVDCLCVPEHPEPDAYVRMLADLAGTPSESAARAAFGVFAHFGRLIEEGALEDTDPRWRKLGKMVVFPTTDFHWLSARDHIYINDCKSFRSPLPVRGGITYMYVPPEHRLLSQGISFAAMLGVRCISEALSLRSIVDAPEPDSELLEFVRDNILYVQRFVKKRYPDIYASLGQEFAAALAGFRVFTASRISGVWCIDGDRETNPIPYDALLDGNTLYYRRAKKVHRYDRCVLNELSKFFLGNTHDTTVMVAFFGTLARDSDNENFGAEMEKYIGPELGDTEERWVVRFEDDKEVTPEPMFVEDAARIGEPEVTTNNNNNNNSSIVVSVPASHDSSTTVDNGTITAAATTAATVTTPTVVPEHVVVAAAGRPLNTLDDEEKRTIGVRGEEIVFEALKSQHPHDTVVWCNEESETGFPYDLVVSDANGKNKRYIEVKATKTLDKPFFEVSFREWMFSQEHRDRFFIYRVFGALSDAPRVLRIQNPFKEWSLGNLGMLLSIKNTTSSN